MKRRFEELGKEVDELVQLGESLVARASQAKSSLAGRELAEAIMWFTRVGQMIHTLYPGANSHSEIFEHAKNIRGLTVIHANNYAHLAEAQGIALAIHHELKAGLLSDVQRLLQADIFADFLEMAEHLLNEGYKDAAAVLIGGVLEDSLRKVAGASSVQTTDAKGRHLTIDPLNVSLAKAGVYSALVQKQITSWADVRNSAAHGHFAKYQSDDVRQMLQFVQKFCSDFLR